MTGADLLDLPERVLRATLRRLLSIWVQVQVFPEPLGPTLTTTSPSATWVLTFFRACTSVP